MAAERLQVILELVTGQYKKEASEAAASTKKIGAEAAKTGTGLTKMSTGMKLVSVAAAGVVATKVLTFLGDATKAAAEDEKGQRLLALALDNATDATIAETNAVEGWIDQLARATGVADDKLRPALANLVRANGDVKKSQDELGVAMNIATARGLDVEAVTLAMSKAQLGNVGALGRLGIATKDAEGKMLTYDEVLANASRTMGGAAAEAADTLEGKLARQNVAWDEANESIGTALIPLMEEAIPLLEHAATTVGVLATEFQQWTGSVDDIDAAIQNFTLQMGISADTAAAALTIWQSGGIEFGELLDRLQLAPEELLKLRNATDEFLFTQGVTNEAVAEFRRNVDDSIISQGNAARDSGRHRSAVEEVAEAYDDTADAVTEAMTALEKYEDEVRSQTDPLYALRSAVNDVGTAQAGVADAQEEFGTKSPEYADAVLALAQANEDLRAAQFTVADQSDMTRQQYEDHLRSMAGMTPEMIDVILAELERINAFDLSDKSFSVTLRGGSGSSFSDSLKGNKASGGPVSAGHMYRAGEGNRPELLVIPGDNGRILSNSQMMALINGGAGAGSSTQINVSGFTRDLDESIRLAGMYAGISRRIEARRR